MIAPFSLLTIALLPLPPVATSTPGLAASLPQDLDDGAPPESAFDYDYVEAGLVFGDLDGFRVGGSLSLDDPWVALGRLEFLSDDGGADVDLFLLSGGVGYVHTLEPDLDLIGSAEIEFGDLEVETPGGGENDDDDLGLRLRVGVRYQVDQELELAGGVSLRTIFDEDVGADGRVLYAFNEKVSGFVGLDIQDDTFAILGVRYSL